MLIYSYFQKVSDLEEEAKILRKKLAMFKKENTQLNETLAWQHKELLLFSCLMSEVQFEAFEASMARDQAESKLSDKLNNLKAEHAQL